MVISRSTLLWAILIVWAGLLGMAMPFGLSANPTAPTNPTAAPKQDFVLPPVNEIHLVAAAMIEFYHGFITDQDRPSCIFVPSCSEYMRQALAEWGMTGLFMGIDRIHRCHSINAAHSKLYPRNEQNKLIDPVPLRCRGENCE